MEFSFLAYRQAMLGGYISTILTFVVMQKNTAYNLILAVEQIIWNISCCSVD